MAWALLSLTTCPPGEFIYEQTEGIKRKFKFSDIYTLGNMVADFRKANGLPRPTQDEAVVDIVAYTCERLGNNPRFCFNTDKSIQDTVPRRSGRPGGGCSTCGH